MRLKQNMKKKNGEIMKLNAKQKRSIKRRVEIEQGISSPRHIVFKSKKIYSRKNKHKLNTNEDG